MNIKLLVADVDGTLLTSGKELTLETRDAVDRLRASGVELVVTSGRPPRGIASLVGPLKLTAPLAGFNGGIYIDPDLKTVRAQRTLAPGIARAVVDYLLEAGLDVWVYSGSDWFIANPNVPRIARERSNVGFDPILVSDLHAVLDGPIKIVGVSMDHARVARCETELGARLGADASAARSQPYYLDVTHPEANKGMVVREAARFFKIGVDQVAAIGDMANDVPMLSVAGMSIAMGNAPPEVQVLARHVTRSNNENGFAYAVDSFILGEPPLARTTLGLPPRTRACVFGLDGVLVQSAKLHAEAWKLLFDPYLRERARSANVPMVPFDAVNEYSAHFRARSWFDGLRSFLVARGVELPDKTLHALHERKNELYLQLLAQQPVETYEGSVRYLRAAHEAGLRTAVVSTRSHCHQALESAGIANLIDAEIDAAVAESEHLEARPAPDTYWAAARALGVDSEDAVVFEDELFGLEAARAGHFAYVVGIDRFGHEADLRRHGAEVVVPDLAALMGP